MSLKDTFKKNMEDKEIMKEFKYISSKTTFIFVSFLFFSCFFLIGSGFCEKQTSTFFSPLYVMLIISFNVFLYYFLNRQKYIKKSISYIIFVLSIVLSLIFLLIVII